MMHDSSNRMGNQPRTQTRSPGATFMSSLVYSRRAWTYDTLSRFIPSSPPQVKHTQHLTCGRSETYLAQCRMRRMASMLVSGKAALHTNSDKHFTASWNESMAAAKCSWKVFTDEEEERKESTTAGLQRLLLSEGQSLHFLVFILGATRRRLDETCVVLTDDVARRLEGQLHDGLVVVRGSLVEHREDVLPTRADVGRLGVHHLSHAPDHHVSDGGGPEGTKGAQFSSDCSLWVCTPFYIKI